MSLSSIFNIGLLLSLPILAMDNKQSVVINQSNEPTEEIIVDVIKERKRRIIFNAVATIKMGLTSRHVAHYCQKDNPDTVLPSDFLIESSKKPAPYTEGNGGLLNPLLEQYEIKREPINGEGYTGIRVEIIGYVAADGIASYKFDKTHMGEHYSKTCTHPETKEVYKLAEYKMSRLEEAILGVLKERMVDRQLSHLSNVCFDDASATPFARRFIACVKHEWTSKKSDQDSGIRTAQEDELIQRHMARSTFLPSEWHNPKSMRTGEYIRKDLLDGDTDPYASVELNEFEVLITTPCSNQSSNQNSNGCLIQ